jgi:Bacterial Ig domain
MQFTLLSCSEPDHVMTIQPPVAVSLSPAASCRAVVAAVTLMSLTAVSAAAQEVDLTSERWILENSVDNKGLIWNDSRLVIATQTATAMGFDLAGYFDWTSTSGPFGREIVTGSYTSTTRRLLLFGQQIDPTLPSSGIVPATYGATLSADGLRLENGAWSATEVLPGVWSARRGGPPPPRSLPDTYSAIRNTQLVIPAPGVLANDVGGTSVSLVSGPGIGSLALSANGGFSYTPLTDFIGPVSFTYRASNPSGPGNVATVSLPVSVAPTLLPPSDLIAASIVGNLVTLRWTPPSTGIVPTGYVMDGGVAPGQVLASLPTAGPTPSLTFSAPTGSFYLRVRSVAGAVTSAASNEIRVFVNVAQAPSAPTHLLGLVNGSTLALAWRNTFGGGAPGNVILDVSGSLNASLPIGLADSFTFAPVPGGNYTFRVRAQNAAGVSGPSNSESLSFPSPCSGPPSSPENLAAFAVGNVINLGWNPASAGRAPTGFVLNVSGAYNLALPLSTRGISAPVPPGSYTFTVAAANACGTSPATAPQTVVVP